jgi:hypothetical protein
LGSVRRTPPSVLVGKRATAPPWPGTGRPRLPLTVAPVFREWLQREQPARLSRIEGRIRDARGGKLNDAEFGRRMRGTGEMARQIGQLFRLFARRHGLAGDLPPYDCSRFRPPSRCGQRWLF